MKLNLKLVSCIGDTSLTMIDIGNQKMTVHPNCIVPWGAGGYWITEEGCLSGSQPDRYLVRITWPDAHKPGPLLLSVPSPSPGMEKCYVRLKNEGEQRPVGKQTGNNSKGVDELFLGDVLGIRMTDAGGFELKVVDPNESETIPGVDWVLRGISFGDEFHLVRDGNFRDPRHVYFRTKEDSAVHLLVMKRRAAESGATLPRSARLLKEDFKSRVGNIRTCLATNPEVNQRGWYPIVVDSGDAFEVYREPFVVERYTQPAPSKSLRDLVEERLATRSEQEDRKQRNRALVVEYAALWSILTQVFQATLGFHACSTGHGALNPDNILLYEGKGDGHYRVIVRSFEYQVSGLPQPPKPGFFFSPETEGSPRQDELKYLKNWIIRDRFALGSLFYYMALGEIPPESSLKDLDRWVDGTLASIETKTNLGDDANWEKIKAFLRACWKVDGRLKNLALLLNDVRPRFKSSQVRPDIRRRSRAWLLLALRAVVTLGLFFMATVLPWSCGRPVFPTAAQAVIAWISTPTSVPPLTTTPIMPTPSMTSSVATSLPDRETKTLVPQAPSPTSTSTIIFASTASPTSAIEPTATKTRPVVLPTITSTPDLGLPLGAGCGDGVAISSPAPWEIIRGDRAIVGTANLNGKIAPGEKDPRPRYFHRYQLWLVKRNTDLANVEGVGMLIVDSAEKRQNSNLGILWLSKAAEQGYGDGEYGLLLRIVYPTGDAQVPGCVVPIRIAADTATPAPRR